MTTQELEAVQDGLTAIDAQLAGFPADGRVAQEVGALREHLDGVAKLVAAAIRGQ